MRGIWHTGCLASFVPESCVTLFSAHNVGEQLGIIAPNNQSRTCRRNLCLWIFHATQLSRHIFCIQISPRLSKLTSVTSLPYSLQSPVDATSRMHNRWLLQDETILMQTSYIAAGVGKWNFIDLIGVEPDFALATFEDRGGEALLKFEWHCFFHLENRG